MKRQRKKKRKKEKKRKEKEKKKKKETKHNNNNNNNNKKHKKHQYCMTANFVQNLLLRKTKTHTHIPTRFHRQSWTRKVVHPQPWTHTQIFTIQTWTVLTVNRLTGDLVLHLR